MLKGAGFEVIDLGHDVPADPLRGRRRRARRLAHRAVGAAHDDDAGHAGGRRAGARARARAAGSGSSSAARRSRKPGPARSAPTAMPMMPPTPWSASARSAREPPCDVAAFLDRVRGGDTLDRRRRLGHDADGARPEAGRAPGDLQPRTAGRPRGDRAAVPRGGRPHHHHQYLRRLAAAPRPARTGRIDRDHQSERRRRAAPRGGRPCLRLRRHRPVRPPARAVRRRGSAVSCSPVSSVRPAPWQPPAWTCSASRP